MGREVRRVPANWQHPKNECGNFVPLMDGYARHAQSWDDEAAKWARGEFPEYVKDEGRSMSYEEWAGERPRPEDYMPDWPEAERTHYMMYEDTTEGTPISPAFATPEELARWLVDNNASAFGGMTGSYEGWLRVARGAFAPSLIMDEHGLRSGVEAA